MSMKCSFVSAIQPTPNAVREINYSRPACGDGSSFTVHDSGQLTRPTPLVGNEIDHEHLDFERNLFRKIGHGSPGEEADRAD